MTQTDVEVYSHRVCEVSNILFLIFPQEIALWPFNILQQTEEVIHHLKWLVSMNFFICDNVMLYNDSNIINFS